MENKEKLNTNIKYLKDLYNKLNELNDEYDKIDNNFKAFTKDKTFDKLNTKENKIIMDEFRYQEKENIKKRDILVYEKNIIYNNLDLILMNIIKNELLPILKKYEGKAVGEKTKEKMKNDIKTYILEHYNLNCYFGIYKQYSFSSILLSFGFYKVDDNYVRINKRDMELGTNEYEYMHIKYNIENLVPYYENYDYKYVELESVSGYASNLYNMRVLTENNIKKLNDEISKLKSDFNGYCLNNLNNYRI